MQLCIEQLHHEREKQIALTSQIEALEESLNVDKLYLQDLDSHLK